MNKEKTKRNAQKFKLVSTSFSKILFMFVLLILLSSTTFALGIAPSRQYFSYSPGQVIKGELTIINNEGNEFRAGIYADGELTETVTFPQALVDVPEGQLMTKIPYEIKLPIAAPKPGEHTIKLVVRQFPKDSKVGDSIGAQLAVISQIIIKVPYPGKYAEGKMFISNTDKVGEPVTFAIMMYNFGLEDIKDTYAEIKIYGPSWEPVGTTDTEHTLLESKQEKRLNAKWASNVEKGSYTAVAKVHYDDKVLEIQEPFDLGEFSIDIRDISVDKFRLGDVAKFDISLHNGWNKAINNVYVEMTVEDQKGNVQTEFETKTVNMKPNELKKLEAYWDTDKVLPGIYNAKFLVYYEDRMIQEDYSFEVQTNSITKVDPSGYAISGETKQGNIEFQSMIIILIVIVVILMISMNLIWFFVLTKKLKGGKK